MGLLKALLGFDLFGTSDKAPTLPPEGLEDIRILPPRTMTAGALKEGEQGRAFIFFTGDGTPHLIGPGQHILADSSVSADYVWMKDGRIMGRLKQAPNMNSYSEFYTLQKHHIRVWLVERP